VDLDPRQTAAVRAVIETGSFEQAAVRLNITSSAVSQRVRALETRLGNPLIVRTRPCRATQMGQRLLQYLRRAALLEDDFASDLAGANEALLNVAAAVNADTLSTWFFPALSEILLQENVLLDLTVDDQDHTHALLASGLAIGCITTEPAPMRGCFAERLGAMRYRLVASAAFVERWFPNGLTREGARRAPVILSSRKDALQARFLETRFGLPPEAYPCHYVPAPVPRYMAIQRGLVWHGARTGIRRCRRARRTGRPCAEAAHRRRVVLARLEGPVATPRKALGAHRRTRPHGAGSAGHQGQTQTRRLNRTEGQWRIGGNDPLLAVAGLAGAAAAGLAVTFAPLAGAFV